MVNWSDDHLAAGGEIDRITVAVRVMGDTLDPEAVTGVMGVAPTFAATRGDRRVEGGRTVVQRVGVWLLDFAGNPDEWTIEDAIEELLKRLPSDRTVWHELARTYQLNVSCGLHMRSFNRGLRMQPALLRRLAERELGIDFDIYYVGMGDGPL